MFISLNLPKKTVAAINAEVPYKRRERHLVRLLAAFLVF